MRKTILAVEEGCLSKEAEEKLKAMRMLNINIGAFIEWAIIDFNVDNILLTQIENNY